MIFELKEGDEKSMGDYKIRYRNANLSNQKIELDGKSFIHCEFQDCIIILERGETEISGCSFKNCKLMLRENAYTVGRIIKFFTGKGPLKVLDMKEPLFEKDGHPFAKLMNDKQKEMVVPSKNSWHSKFHKIVG